MTQKILAVCGVAMIAYVVWVVAWRNTRIPGREPDMEGTPPDAGTPDPVAELRQRLEVLTGSISDATQRVNTDLSNLKAEVERLNEQHDDVDLSGVIAQVDQLIVNVQNIDVTESGEGDVSIGGAGAPIEQGPEGSVEKAPPEPGVKPAEEAVEGEQG